jgi:hypothetical protein
VLATITVLDVDAANSIPQLSPGGNRAYTFQDMIGILNQDIQNVGAPDLSLDAAFTNFIPVNEAMRMLDATGLTLTAFTGYVKVTGQAVDQIGFSANGHVIVTGTALEIETARLAADGKAIITGQGDIIDIHVQADGKVKVTGAAGDTIV